MKTKQQRQRLAKMEGAPIANKLPSTFRPRRSPPPDLVGATISAFGTFKDDRLAESGGGLVIEYIADGINRRLVLGFDETAMWVDALFPAPQAERA
jgi:hypothetical protein